MSISPYISGLAMTIEEELAKLNDQILCPRIEFEVYFNDGLPRSPLDTQWRLENTVKQCGDGQKLNFSQRFRFNIVMKKYTVYRNFWRQKLKGTEKDRGHFAGLGAQEESQKTAPGAPQKIVYRDPSQKTEKVDQLLRAMVNAKQRCGESVANLDPVAFQKFVRDKTKKIQESLSCKSIGYVVAVEGGKTKLKANRGEKKSSHKCVFARSRQGTAAVMPRNTLITEALAPEVACHIVRYVTSRIDETGSDYSELLSKSFPIFLPET